MKSAEIQELLNLKDWSRTDLASELDITEAAVHKWFRLGQAPKGAVSILLRLWLDQARAERASQPPEPASA